MPDVRTAALRTVGTQLSGQRLAVDEVAAMTTVMLSRVQDRAFLQAEHDESLRQRFIAEATFAAIVACYERKYPGDPVTAKFQALANPSLRDAMSDAKWYGEKAEMLAAALASKGGAP